MLLQLARTLGWEPAFPRPRWLPQARASHRHADIVARALGRDGGQKGLAAAISCVAYPTTGRAKSDPRPPASSQHMRNGSLLHADGLLGAMSPAVRSAWRTSLEAAMANQGVRQPQAPRAGMEGGDAAL
jgi:hypothetical protein